MTTEIIVKQERGEISLSLAHKILWLGALTGAAIAAIIALCVPAGAHGHWSWIMEFSNANGVNCCDERDAVSIPHEVANAARIGTVIVASFPSGVKPVAVNVIHQTKDPAGKAWISLHGCLFVNKGM